jgi:hypothetical protein
MRSTPRREWIVLCVGAAAVMLAMLFVSRLGFAWFLVLGGIGMALLWIGALPSMERDRVRRGKVVVLEDALLLGGIIAIFAVSVLTGHGSYAFLGFVWVLAFSHVQKRRRERI